MKSSYGGCRLQAFVFPQSAGWKSEIRVYLLIVFFLGGGRKKGRGRKGGRESI
jgi:hypothetical protein